MFEHCDIFILKNCKKPRACQIYSSIHTSSIDLPTNYDVLTKADYAELLEAKNENESDYHNMEYFLETYDDWKIPYMSLSKNPNKSYRLNYTKKTDKYKHHIGLTLPKDYDFSLNARIITLNCMIAENYGEEFMLIHKLEE